MMGKLPGPPRKNPVPTIFALSWRFAYDPDTGEFTGRRGPIKPNAKGRVQLSWQDEEGESHSVYGPRFAFALMTGRWPDEDKVIDHINGNPSDNRWHNLREVTVSENALNSDKVGRSMFRKCRGWSRAANGSFLVSTCVAGRRFMIRTKSAARGREFYILQQVFRHCVEMRRKAGIPETDLPNQPPRYRWRPFEARDPKRLP